MYEIDPAMVTGWVSQGARWSPDGINIHCPRCGEKGTFTLVSPTYNQPTDTISAAAPCPTCRKQSFFYIVRPGKSDDRSQMGCKSLVMWPPPKLPRTPIDGADFLDAPTRGTYIEAIEGFNAGAWRSASICCRVTLEALVKSLDPSGKGTLDNRIRKLPENVDLDAPLLTLANLIRRAGNLSAHFIEDQQPTRELAEHILLLTEYLMEYLFTLPKLIDALDTELTRLAESPDEGNA